MLKRNITYTDYNGTEVTETFYFNITKPELLEMELSIDGGFGDYIKKIVASQDTKVLVETFKSLILKAYGQKSEDGKRFIKNDQLREEFQQTAAYATLFMDLATNDQSAASFVRGIIPQDMLLEVEKEQKQAQIAARQQTDFVI